MSTPGAHLFAGLTVLALALAAPGATAAAHEDPNPEATDWVEADFTMRVTAALDRLLLTGTLRVHEADAGELLAPLCGASCTADDLRAIHADGSEAQRDVLVSGIEDRAAQRARDSLAAVAGTSEGLDVSATLRLATIESAPGGSPYHDALVVDVTGSAPIVELEGVGIGPDQVGPLFAMGARITIGFTETVAAGNNLTLTLELPEPLAVLEASSAALSEDGRAATWSLDRWRSSDGVLADAVLVGRPDIVVPGEEDLDVHVTLDLADLDIHYTNLLAGSEMATLDVALSVDGTFRAIAVPPELQELLALDALSADAVRIGLAAGLIEVPDISALETEARTAVAEMFRSSFGVEVTVEGGFDDAALATTALGDPLGTGAPITMRIAAATNVLLPPAEPVDGAAAFTVASIPLPAIELPELGLPGDSQVRFTIVLPPGLEIALPPDAEKTATTSTTVDGRTAVTFTRGADASDGPVTVQGAQVLVQHGAIVRLFWPVLLVLFLVLVVAPGTLIALVVVGRRRKRRRLEALRDQSGGATPPRTHARENAERAKAVPSQGGEVRGGQA